MLKATTSRSPLRLAPALIFTLALSLGTTTMSYAETTLPAAVQAQSHTPLAKVGSGSYRKFGFRIYNATLWAPGGVWSADKPYALELHYTRSLSKDTVVESVTDDIRDQGTADDATMARWTKTLNDTLPAIEEDDVLIGLAIPGEQSQLFYNGKKIASLEDPAFSKAFFNIWLGQGADEDLRADLLGHKP